MTNQNDNTSPTPTNAPVECEWSDEIFLNKFAFLGACNARPDLPTGVLAAKALLNWYMGGDKPKNSTDSILATFYCMTLDRCENNSSTPLFSDQLMKDGPALQLPDTVEKIDPKSYRSKLMQIASPQNENLRNPALTKKLATEWYNEIWAWLDDDGIGQKQLAINILGYLYMILLRLCVKQVCSVSKYIFQRSTTSYITLCGGPYPLIFCPPHEAMALSFKKKYARFQPDCVKMMSAIVYSYYDGLHGLNGRLIWRMFKASCLSSLEKVGLGLLTWTEKAESASGFPKNKLIKHMLTKSSRRHKDTILSYFKFCEKYERSAQYTWPWARLFEDEALADLRTAKDPMYVMTMVAFVHLGDKVRDTWDIPSLKKEYVVAHKEEAISLAKEIKEDLIREESKCFAMQFLLK